MLIRTRHLAYGAAKLLSLCPLLAVSAWLDWRPIDGPVSLPGIAGYWPRELRAWSEVLASVISLPLLLVSAALIFLYLRADGLRRVLPAFLLLGFWLLALPVVARSCFYLFCWRV